MIGYCPCCGVQIHEMRGARPVMPLGNYRSIALFREEGNKVIFPCCVDCHDSFSEEKLPEVVDKLASYVIDALPSGWDEQKRLSYSDQVRNLKVVGFQKQGPLNKKDAEEGQIWR